jgi:hypothetical protein
MGMLSNIFHKIFPSSHPAVAQADAPTTAPAGSVAGSAAPASVTSPAASTQNMPEVDVEQILNGMAQSAGQTFNWRTSIVDLLKLLGLDNSLQSRKELAGELGYSGDTNDSASMNIWLHRQVMNKLAANGGKVPADLKD